MAKGHYVAEKGLPHTAIYTLLASIIAGLKATLGLIAVLSSLGLLVLTALLLSNLIGAEDPSIGIAFALFFCFIALLVEVIRLPLNDSFHEWSLQKLILVLIIRCYVESVVPLVVLGLGWAGMLSVVARLWPDKAQSLKW